MPRIHQFDINDRKRPKTKAFMNQLALIAKEDLAQHGVDETSREYATVLAAMVDWLGAHVDDFAVDDAFAVEWGDRPTYEYSITDFWLTNPDLAARHALDLAKLPRRVVPDPQPTPAEPPLRSAPAAGTQHIIGYARVSTTQQSTAVQRAALLKAGATELFIDEAVSGSANHDSAQFKAMMRRVEELRARNEPVLVRVTKLDRFSRSLPHFLTSVERLGNLGASFEALDGFVYDAESPVSIFILSMFGALSQFERSLIKVRMAEGRAHAKANGRIFGRRPTLTQAAVDAIRKERAEDGTTDRQLAKKWDVSRTLIQRVLNIAGYTQPYVTADEWDAARKATAKKG